MRKRAIYIIAGPNGSGKTTFAKEFIAEIKLPFLNADEIALGLSPNDIQAKRLTAGRQFLRVIDRLVHEGKSFAVETTMAGKYWLPLLKNIKRRKYSIYLIYIFVENIKEALKRIDVRVKKGGHSVPVEDVRRRFRRSKINFWNIYRKRVDDWQIFLNSKDEFLLVAKGAGRKRKVLNEAGFKFFLEGFDETQ